MAPLSLESLSRALPKAVVRNPTRKETTAIREHKGFMRGKTEGPFRCDHCEYYDDGTCGQVVVVKWAKEGKYGLKLDGGRAIVNPDDCSDYFEKR